MFNSPVSREEVDRILALVERQRERMAAEAARKRQLAIENRNAAAQPTYGERSVARTKCGRPFRGKLQYTPETHAKVQQMREAGTPWDSVAQNLGVSRAWVRRRWSELTGK